MTKVHFLILLCMLTTSLSSGDDIVGISADTNIAVGDRTYSASFYDIKEKSESGWLSIARFPRPTVETLLRHRPKVKSRYGYDEKRHSFFDMVLSVESKIAVATVFGRKIWVGFSFYEGECHEGIGGIGFYDTKTKDIGVLRHPALVDCSINSLMISDDGIVAVTSKYGEYGQSVCNGVVRINLKTLEAKAYLPPKGAMIVDHKEGRPNNVKGGAVHNRPASELTKQLEFLIERQVPNWEKPECDRILAVGLESHMIDQANRERCIWDKALAKASLTQGICRLSEENNRCEFRGLDMGEGDGYVLTFVSLNTASGYRCKPGGLFYISVHFSPPSIIASSFDEPYKAYTLKATSRDPSPYRDSKVWEPRKGLSWEWRSSKGLVKVTLVDFREVETTCNSPFEEFSGTLIEYAIFKAQMYEVNE